MNESGYVNLTLSFLQFEIVIDKQANHNHALVKNYSIFFIKSKEFFVVKFVLLNIIRPHTMAAINLAKTISMTIRLGTLPITKKIISLKIFISLH